MAQQEEALSPAHRTAAACGQEHGAHGHLIRKPKRIGGVSPCGQDARVIPTGDRVVKRASIRTENAKQWTYHGQMIEPAPGATKDADLRIAGKGFVHSRPGAEIKEVRRRPDIVLRPGLDAVEDGGVDGVGVFLHDFVRKMHSFSDKSKAEVDFFRDGVQTPRRRGGSEGKLIRDGLGVMLGRWGSFSAKLWGCCHGFAR